mgnify:CR=1 FL=1
MKLTYEINISEKDLGLDYKYDVGTSSLDLMFLNENGFRMEFAVLHGNNNIDEIKVLKSRTFCGKYYKIIFKKFGTKMKYSFMKVSLHQSASL